MNGAGRWKKGRNVSWRNRSLHAEKARAGLQHAVICPNVTGRIKERIAQSKRARDGSLATVDYGHTWRELVSSGCLVCRCHIVFL